MLKKFIKRFIIVLLSIAGIFAIFYIVPRPKSSENNNFEIKKGDRPLLIAHGGGNGEFPDNTLEAYINAVSIDANCMLETDVNITKDGVVILSHDVTLDRKTNVKGKIIDWNYTDLMEAQVNFNYNNPTSEGDDGVKISNTLVEYVNYKGEKVTPQQVNYPLGVSQRNDSKFLATTLEQLITVFPNNSINVEIKQSGQTGLEALAEVVKLIDKLDSQYNTYNRIILATFHNEIYKQIKEYKKNNYPKLKFAPDEANLKFLYISHWLGLDFLYSEPVTVLQIPTSQGGVPLNWKWFINAAHRHNIAVHYWTINDENEMKALALKGADGIMSDIPSRLKNVLDTLYGVGDSTNILK